MPSFILDTVERTSLGTTLATDLSGGTLKIYSGAYATGTLLATFTLPSLSGSNVSGGVLTLPAIAQVNAVAPGTAAYFTLSDSGGTERAHGDVATSGASVNLINLNIANGQPVSITSATITVPAGS
jgi:hypothetical protein